MEEIPNKHYTTRNQVNLFIDRDIYREFRARCDIRGLKSSRVVERFMFKYTEDSKAKAYLAAVGAKDDKAE